MAIQDELERDQLSTFTTATRPIDKQCYPQQWSQQIPNQGLQAPSLKQQLPLLTTSRIQSFASRLAKETLRQYLNIITTPLPLPRGGAHLELLPQSIINRICQHIPYEELIWLSQESKALNRIINPRLAPYETKLSFVLRAERDFLKHYNRSPPNLGCYMCHRVLPADLFASNQPLQALLRGAPEGEHQQPQQQQQQSVVVNLRRFCIHCGIQSGCHNAGDELNTRTGGRFWLCECLQVLGENTSGCKACGALSPLMPRAMGRSKVPRI